MERSTRQRSSIRAVMEAAGRPLLPAEILHAAQHAVPAIGLATVYRNIKQLTEAGEVQAVELPGEATRYELTGHAHHHHFRCTRCERVFDIPGCPGDMQELAPPGFVIEQHALTLYGRCGDCHRQPPAAGALKTSPAGPR